MKKQVENLIQVRTRKPIMVNVKMHEMVMSLAQCSIIKELWLSIREKCHIIHLLDAGIT